jgi:hypothetical protein
MSAVSMGSEWLSRSLIDIDEVVRQLGGVFGPPSVAALAGQRDRKIAYRWARVDGPRPNLPAQQRLYAVYRLWLGLLDARDHTIASAWFFAADPLLGERSPLALLCEGQIAPVATAATTFAADRKRSGRIADWHEASLIAPRSLVRDSMSFFGAATTAAFAGETDRKIAYRWVRPGGALPSAEAQRRLSAIHRVRLALTAVGSEPMARAWFVAANPLLGERMPLTAAKEGRLVELVAAADNLLVTLRAVRKIA